MNRWTLTTQTRNLRQIAKHRVTKNVRILIHSTGTVISMINKLQQKVNIAHWYCVLSNSQINGEQIRNFQVIRVQERTTKIVLAYYYLFEALRFKMTYRLHKITAVFVFHRSCTVLMDHLPTEMNIFKLLGVRQKKKNNERDVTANCTQWLLCLQ